LAGCADDFANPPGDREAQVAVINAGDVAPKADDFVEQLGVRVKVAGTVEVDGVIVILPSPWRQIAGTVRAMHGVVAVFIGAPTAEQLTEAVAAVKVKRSSPTGRAEFDRRSERVAVGPCPPSAQRIAPLSAETRRDDGPLVSVETLTCGGAV